MATEARVRSLDDLEAFRSSLVVYLTKARRNVDQVGEEVRRTRIWITNEQRTYWTEQVRKRSRMLDQANAELMTAKLSNFRDNITAQEQAVRKAKAALDHAQQKVEMVKRWNRDFDRLTDPLMRKLDSMRHFLEHVLPEGITQIGQLHRLLETYAETGQILGGPKPAEPAPESAAPSNPPPSP
jgi:DNA repair exonuclease SbcCD ATPase subunit